MTRVLMVSALSLLALPTTALGQTMQSVAAGQTSCSTIGGEGLSAQLVATQQCLRPGQFVSFANDDITATSGRVHLVAQASARDALHTAAATVPLQINSAFRPLSDQYLLWASGQCSVVATPGGSNHQSGRAVDVNNTTEARTALTSAGCVWFGATDAVHYDCPGSDLRDDAVFTFQRLWNINNPTDLLVEDGAWGPNTRSRMDQSPAAGFTYGGLDACGPCPMGEPLNACSECGPAPTEICNGVDDDCDGAMDEGCGVPDMGMPDMGVSTDGGVPADLAVEDTGVDGDGDVASDLATPGGDAGGPPPGGATSGCSATASYAPGDRAGALWVALVALSALGFRRRRERITLRG